MHSDYTITGKMYFSIVLQMHLELLECVNVVRLFILRNEHMELKGDRLGPKILGKLLLFP